MQSETAMIHLVAD